MKRYIDIYTLLLTVFILTTGSDEVRAGADTAEDSCRSAYHSAYEILDDYIRSKSDPDVKVGRLCRKDRVALFDRCVDLNDGRWHGPDEFQSSSMTGMASCCHHLNAKDMGALQVCGHYSKKRTVEQQISLFNNCKANGGDNYTPNCCDHFDSSEGPRHVRACGYKSKSDKFWTGIARTFSGDALIEAITGKSYEDIIKRAIKDIENAPKSWGNCVSDIAECSDKEARRILYRTLWPVIERYKAHLEKSAKHKWRKLSPTFIQEFSGYYPSLNLSNIRYADKIDTLHGQAITWGNHIYFPTTLNLDSPGHLQWMLHEIQHSVQYQGRGGYKEFLGEYIWKAFGKVLENGHFDVHDFIGPERAAASTASRIMALRKTVNGCLSDYHSTDEILADFVQAKTNPNVKVGRLCRKDRVGLYDRCLVLNGGNVHGPDEFQNTSCCNHLQLADQKAVGACGH